MAEPENQAPVFLRLTAEDLTDDGNIVLQFLAKDDQLYRVEIAKPIIGGVVISIIGLLNKTQLATLDTTRRRSDPLMSLQLTAFRAMVTPKGAPGLAMVLANALEVGIAHLPRKPSFRWIPGRSCTNIHTGPFNGGRPLCIS